MRVAPGSWRRASVLALGLVVAAGCSANKPPDKPPPPSPLPSPTRALVIWSDTMCTSVQSIDDLRTRIDSVNRDAADEAGSDAEEYIVEIGTDLDDATNALTDIRPSGIKAADAYTAGLLGTLNGIRPKLPKQGDVVTLPDDQKVAKAKQIAGIIATIKPQAPVLARMAAANRALAGSYNLAPDCAPVKPPGRPATSASRARVVWSATVCADTRSVAELRGQRPTGDSRVAGVQLQHFIGSAAPQLSDIRDDLAALPPTGVKEADGYRSSLIAAIQRALPKLPKESDLDPFAVADARTKAKAERVARTLATVKAQGPDLRNIAAHNPAFATSYNLAPGCDPVTRPGSPTADPLPSASNGTDVNACESGKCQVRVSKSADIAVLGMKFSVSVGPAGVRVAHGRDLDQLGPGGSGSFGDAGRTVTFHVVGLTATTAVLDISAT